MTLKNSIKMIMIDIIYFFTFVSNLPEFLNKLPKKVYIYIYFLSS